MAGALIRSKMTDETPEPMHLCGCWYALPPATSRRYSTPSTCRTPLPRPCGSGSRHGTTTTTTGHRLVRTPDAGACTSRPCSTAGPLCSASLPTTRPGPRGQPSPVSADRLAAAASRPHGAAPRSPDPWRLTPSEQHEPADQAHKGQIQESRGTCPPRLDAQVNHAVRILARHTPQVSGRSRRRRPGGCAG
jgi:hypothetical protein